VAQWWLENEPPRGFFLRHRDRHGDCRNKVHGIRAGVVWNPEISALASEHNGVNVLCIPPVSSPLQSRAMIKAYLNTPFGGGGICAASKNLRAR